MIKTSFYSGPSRHRFPWILAALLLLAFCARTVLAAEATAVGADERGEKRTGQAEVWHDPHGGRSLVEAVRVYEIGAFKPLPGSGSTGLKRGAFWSHFALHNPSDRAVTVNIEYIDHQLIELTAYARDSAEQGTYRQLAQLSMLAPFERRPVSHNRFVFPLTLQAGQTQELMVRFSSGEIGFVFPSMRIWSPANLGASHTLETGGMAFLFGGFLLMSIFALVVGIATGGRSFYAYSIYALSKITAWGTILGFTHQYLIRTDFQWRYMSIGGALSILAGLAFARIFLRTRRYAPKLDRVLLLMLANATLLLISAVLEIKALALVTITLALLLYPVVTVAGLVRWRQGSLGAGIFTLAWGLLVVSLFAQALRDMGLVAHNLFNYYLPPVASFTEMLAIMAAMGLRMRRLGLQKQVAEQHYREHLERSRAELEELVCERTRALEEAKRRAETEARTDPLTGIRNRRSFFADAEERLKLAKRQSLPVSLLMFDIDNFKSINDRHGHSVGDEALRSFCQTILGKIRETDIFGRIGGEEFGLLVTEEPGRAVIGAERLRNNIARIAVQVSGGTLQFTSSIGIAHGDGSSTLDSLLKSADSALYVAKRRGRDIVVEYTVSAAAAGTASA